jgi:hypothetical protein
VVATCALLGCGRVDFDPVRCDPAAPFGPPVLVPSLSTPQQDASARLTADELTVFVSRYNGTTTLVDTFIATRTDRDAPFGAATPLALNTPNDDYLPSPTDDGAELVYETLGAERDLFLTTRASGYGAGTLLGVSTPNEDQEPFLRPDGQVLYFVSDRGGNPDIYRSVRVNGDFTTAVAVNELNTLDEERAMVVTRDDMTIYLASKRGGSLTTDIYEAHRPARDQPFSQPVSVDVLNTPGNDYPSWLSVDGCVMYLVSDGPTGQTQDTDVYIATRSL